MAPWCRVGSGSYRWFVYITTLLLQEASGLPNCIVGHPNSTSAPSILLVLLDPHYGVGMLAARLLSVYKGLYSATCYFSLISSKIV